MHTDLPLAISAGEPAGIGPDIILQWLQQPLETPVVIYGDPAVFEARIKQLRLPADTLTQQPQLHFETIACQHPVTPGTLSADNAPAVVEMITQATTACAERRCRALVTAPVHKGIINAAGIPFTGHTEHLAKQLDVSQTVMLLVCHDMKVALFTTHCPIAAVSKALTAARLKRCIEIIDHDLQVRFHVRNPHIRVCGLNPHAGEDGFLGDEEQTIMQPTLATLCASGYQVSGPVSADTAFLSRKNVDVILAMYHDQGLPVIKTHSFGKAVNITLGLPIWRTSVDHGVALDLAGSGRADASSFLLACHYALTL